MASGNDSGFTVLLVCAVRSHRVSSSPITSASDGFDEPTCLHDYSNPAPLTLDARNTIDRSVPAPFALVLNPLAHAWKSALVLGKTGATVPANPDSHPPSPGPTGAKPVVDVRGGFVLKDSAIFELSAQKSVIEGPVLREFIGPGRVRKLSLGLVGKRRRNTFRARQQTTPHIAFVSKAGRRRNREYNHAYKNCGMVSIPFDEYRVVVLT